MDPLFETSPASRRTQRDFVRRGIARRSPAAEKWSDHLWFYAKTPPVGPLPPARSSMPLPEKSGPPQLGGAR